jgi:hypothetical protein
LPHTDGFRVSGTSLDYRGWVASGPLLLGDDALESRVFSHFGLMIAREILFHGHCLLQESWLQ